MVKPAAKKPRLEEPEAQNPQNPDSAQDTAAAQPANYSDGAQSPSTPSGFSAGQNLDNFPSAMSVTSETQGYIPHFDNADFNARNPANLLGNTDNMLDTGNSDTFDSKFAFDGQEEVGPEIAKSLADCVERCST